MNTSEINKALKNIKRFGGTFACDLLPLETSKHHNFFVVNTDESIEPGKHWIAIFIDNAGEGEYFDSFGRYPDNKYIKRFLKRNASRGFKYNSIILQHPLAVTCGLYCVEFVQWRSVGNTFECFVQEFTSKLITNEKRIRTLATRPAIKCKKHLKRRR